MISPKDYSTIHAALNARIALAQCCAELGGYTGAGRVIAEAQGALEWLARQRAQWAPDEAVGYDPYPPSARAGLAAAPRQVTA